MYIVLELQTNANGTVSSLINQYEDQNAAESKYHQVLASAAVSSLPIHNAFLITNEGYTIKSETYRHEQAITPDPEEIPGA